MELNEEIFSCMEHVDIAMEEFINDYERSPILVENNNEKCFYCKKNSKYQVK